jgi:hypothetical protein
MNLAFGGKADMQKSHHQAQAGAAPCAKPSQLVQGPTSSPNLNCNCCDFEDRASAWTSSKDFLDLRLTTMTGHRKQSYLLR